MLQLPRVADRGMSLSGAGLVLDRGDARRCGHVAFVWLASDAVAVVTPAKGRHWNRRRRRS